MQCIKCGNRLDEERCQYCGEINHHVRIKEKKIRNKKSLTLIISTFSLFFLLALIAFRSLDECAKREFIEFNNEQIPTIASVVGVKEVSNYIKKENLETLVYDYAQFKTSEIDNYLAKLIEDNYVMYEVDGNGLGLIKEAYDSSKVILVNLDVENGNLKVVYQHKTDSIKNYKLDGSIRIGNEFIGYMKIPAKFTKVTIKNKHIKYQNVDNIKEVIEINMDDSKKTLLEYTLKEIEKIEASDGLYKKNPITVYGYPGYQLDATFSKEKIYLRKYIFIKEDSNIYEISIESNKDSSEIFSSIYSYEVVK